MALLKIAAELMLLFILATMFLAFLYVTKLWVNPVTETCYRAWTNLFNWIYNTLTGKTHTAPAVYSNNTTCDITGIKCRIARQNGEIIIEGCEKMSIKCR